MTTFRDLLGNINSTKEPSRQSSLELWFEQIIDIPIDSLDVEDICRAIRQKLCIAQLMPRVLTIIDENPLAGEYYDGELIAALSTIKREELEDKEHIFIQIKQLINALDLLTIDEDVRKDILKINKIIS
ncbi:contact-dependent growth inhibition system immunity protein [Serratia microhaemolytica]|uniref:contact-dependent growth inhibition system immunity protein n=1 Tax=Serratia microhaemolytica TaxID=2675110 RepID=UPI000FDE7D87|nr:contact-dependent growth inhibition system immunity protein [Serratia microhaemolytica]